METFSGADLVVLDADGEQVAFDASEARDLLGLTGGLEAATVSGLQAANAVLGLDRWTGISGYWEPLDQRS